MLLQNVKKSIIFYTFGCDFLSLQKLHYLKRMFFLIFHFLEIDLSNLGKLNHFHIIIEPAPNLNKTKIYFSAFFSEFETFRISNQLDPT